MAINTITVIEDVAVEGCSGSGPSYAVSYSSEVTHDSDDGSPPAIPVQLGDWVTVNKRVAGAGGTSTITSVYTYLVTALTNESALTLKYISDTNSDGDDSPCDLPSGTGSSGSPNKAPHTFYRDLGSAFSLFAGMG